MFRIAPLNWAATCIGVWMKTEIYQKEEMHNQKL
jgi:hypothetical protein